MEKYSIISGNALTIKKYLTTWELDNKTFKEKDRILKTTAVNWFKYSNKSTIVLWDNQNNELVGYITPYLLNHEFSCKYIISNNNYKESITQQAFFNQETSQDADLYIFSTVVVKKHQDKPLAGLKKGDKFYNKPAFKVLNEALVNFIIEKKKQGVNIKYVYGEATTKHGEKYFNSLKLQNCSNLKNDHRYATTFTPEMFSKCENVKNLIEIYEERPHKFNHALLNNHEYLSIKNNVLYYKDINLLSLAEKYKTPLKVGYTPMITEKINNLKELFAKKILKYNYPATYNYAYATKANYYSEVVVTALNSVNMLETSSAYDIEIINKLVDLGYVKQNATIICNGFKNEQYINNIKKLLDKKINVIPIIENEHEFNLISNLNEYKINVGIRYNSDFETRLIKNSFLDEERLDNRFGLTKNSLINIANKISKLSNLTLKVFHFHFGGTITNIDNFIKGYTNILNFYSEIKKLHPTIEYLDFGGGFPVNYSLNNSFNYDKLVDEIIKSTSIVCNNNNVDCPNLIGEHGRYTTADHGFFIYKIEVAKKTNSKNWYIINGSLMNTFPDIWSIQQNFTVLPINLYENNFNECFLGGETCDPDDRYFINNKNHKLNLPTINTNQTLYIGIFLTGAYQEMISGVGGVHHCLIPSGNELIITKSNNKYKYIEPSQELKNKNIFDILDYNPAHMNNFKN